MGFTKLEKDVLNISKLPDSVQGNARDLKATFDKAGEDIKKAHNKLVDELAEQNAASNIGAISEEGATTVQAELDKLNDRIKVDFTELEIDIDDELSLESENAVKNKVIAAEFEKTKGMENYELMQLEQVDKALDITTDNIYPVLTSAGNTTLWNGYITGKIDSEEEMPFKMYTENGAKFQLGTGSSSSTIGIYNSSKNNDTTMADLNSLFASGKINTNPAFIINTAPQFVSNIYLEFDFLKPCKPTLEYNIYISYGSLGLQGSNDGIEWFTAATLSNLNTDSYSNSATPELEWRYYRIKLTASSSSGNYRSFTLKRLAWNKVPDIIIKKANHFTVNNDFTKVESKNVIVPQFKNESDVVETTINGLPFEEKLFMGESYRLRYKNGKLGFDSFKCISGTYTGNGKTNSEANATVLDIGFVPKLLLVFTKTAAYSGILSPAAGYGKSISGTSSNELSVKVIGTEIHWWGGSSIGHAGQLNTSGTVYFYVALY